MQLTEIDILSGIFSLLTIVIFTTIGLIIVSKYFKYKRIDLFLFGITIIGLAEPLYGSIISVLLVFYTGRALSIELYLFIALVGNPIVLVCFVGAITQLLYREKQKIILSIAIIYAVVFEIYLIYFLINDPSLVGEMIGITDAEYRGFARIYMITALLTLVIGGTIFSRESLKSDKPEIRLKGKFLLPGFYIFAFSAIIDSAIPLNAITLPIVRSLQIFSAILFYFGLILPYSVKKFFLKEE
ncbi:MAG: hypothetical protein GF383_04770 [Candidatus Lokiarchaeota archaeon]|nr:hypothetical protein [Candidatus Lokiarchaeota archaeon]MBD3339109.1 hypothetical protein [Candidatus Lokiarchaeota archaeon]